MQPTIDTPVSELDLRRLGIAVAVSGDLARLRAKTRITKNNMATMLNLSIAALTAYENATRAVTATVALRIGEWYWGAIRALEAAVVDEIPLHEMLPAATAAQLMARPLPEVEAWCRAGTLRAESLGVLGWYVYDHQAPPPRSPAERERRRVQARNKRANLTPEARERLRVREANRRLARKNLHRDSV